MNPDGSVSIVILLEPRTKKNSQQIFYKKTLKDGKPGKMPFISPSSKYRQYAEDCGIFIKPLGIDYPVNVRAKYYMATKRRVDLTNLNEALHDILSGAGMIADDNCRIVVSTDGSRVYHDKSYPRTEVLITREEPTFI